MQEINNEVRAFEIHEKATAYYRASEQFGYKFLMEVKTIRDEKLYKELGYEDFEQYTLGYFGYSRETITNRIKTAETWGTDYVEALRHFGTTKTHQLATMPETNRSEILERGIPTDNGIKTVEEATTREIEKYQKQLKQQAEQHQRQLAQKDEVINKTYEQLEKAQRQEPKVVEVEKEVVPDDYHELKRDKETLEHHLKLARKSEEYFKQQHKELLEQREEVNQKSLKYDELTQAIQRAEGNLNNYQQKIVSAQNLLNFVNSGKELLVSMSGLIYQDFQVASEFELGEVEKVIEQVQSLIDDVRTKMHRKQIIEGEIIDE